LVAILTCSQTRIENPQNEIYSLDRSVVGVARKNDGPAIFVAFEQA